MHTTVYAATIVGVEGLVVEVEVDLSRGIPTFSIVGLPNTAVRESRERVTAAIKNSRWRFPLERITVNLAPADVKKEGASFDLATAVGILAASGQIDDAVATDDAPGPRRRVEELPAHVRRRVARTVMLGELALDGTLRRVPGVLPALLHAREIGFAHAIVPVDNFSEALVVPGIEVYGCKRLRTAARVVFDDTFAADDDPDCRHKPAGEARVEKGGGDVASAALDMSDVIGQETVKRALVIAAAGAHHVLMVGPPGAGKTMLARRFCTLLPPLDDRAAIETTMIYSTVGLLDGGLVTTSPFRAPHHTASDAGLIGGGMVPRPGEVTLAHNGVLFLDELPEFRRNVLETLREPLEDGRITISRARYTVTFPARFQLLAAMNPCPCGFNGSPSRQCRCSPQVVETYHGKVSGPLLDRISLQVQVRPVDPEAFRRPHAAPEGSAALRDRVIAARERQRRRAGHEGAFVPNGRLPENRLPATCVLSADAETLLVQAQAKFTISARGRAHTIRVARTIADLAGAERIEAEHVKEALAYRVKERT